MINLTEMEAKEREAEKVKGKARVWGELINCRFEAGFVIMI